MSCFRFFACLAAALPIWSHAQAAELTDRQLTVAVVRAGVTPNHAEVLRALTRPIERYDLDGDGLDVEDIEAVDAAKLASTRALGLAVALQYDLDNDHRLTRRELDRARKASGEVGGAFRFEPLDRDKDGVLTLEELADLSSYPEYNRMIRGAANAMSSKVLKSLVSSVDPNQDGVLTIEEARFVANQAFARLDANRNGIIEESERAKP